jgi:predicted lipoprotein
MDGNKLSILTLLGMSSLVLLQNQACTETEDTSKTTAVTTAVVLDVLTGVGPNVVIPTLNKFTFEMELLETRIIELKDALSSQENTDQATSAAQQQWTVAMSVWQELEVMQLGPAGNSLKFIGGEDLRDEIYSWPTVNTCRVDQRTASEAWLSEDFFTANLVNAYGLDALEHLLFASTESTCPSQVVPISDGSWEALGDEGVLQNRADYALVVSQNIMVNTDSIAQGWDSEGGNFAAHLTVSTEDSPYSDETEALNAVYDALFYLETKTKDRKLALPLGLRDCTTETCLEDIEGLESGNSLNALRANLLGFKTLFSGGDEVGIDDLLTDMGHEDLSIQILADVDNAVAFIDELEVPLEVLISDDYSTAMELYDALAKVTTALKVDLATVLQMQVPIEAAGDND